MQSHTATSVPSLLQYSQSAPAVYEALAAVPRTGWVMRGVPNPETVKDHTESLLQLATALLPQLEPKERDGLLEMLEVHDWPEALYGDMVLLELDPEKRTALLEEKFLGEKAALEVLCAALPNRDVLLSLWLRFETATDPAAVLARQLDKYQAVEQALWYETKYGISLFEEFFMYSARFITHPVLVARLEELKSRHAEVVRKQQ